MRIRSIKPEFYRSDDIAALSREDRLLFIGLWSYVDDNGVGIDDHRQIAADLFALDEDQKEVREYVRDGLATLSRGLLIDRYEVSGKCYLYVTGWRKHQKIDRPSKPRYPGPPSDAPPPTSRNGSAPDHVNAPSRDTRDSLDAGTGEQGNRGTGDQYSYRDLGGKRPVTNAQARGTATPPHRYRCQTHQHLDPNDAGPNCIGCRNVRVRAETAAAGQDDAERARRAEIRAAIDACTYCDEAGWVQPDPDSYGGPVDRCERHAQLTSTLRVVS